MGCVYSKCGIHGRKNRKLWSVSSPETEGQGPTNPAQKRVNVIVYRPHKQRLQTASDEPKEPPLDFDGRAEHQHGLASDLDKNAEDMNWDGKTSADIPSQLSNDDIIYMTPSSADIPSELTNDDIYMTPSSDLGEIWHASEGKTTKVVSSRSTASSCDSTLEKWDGLSYFELPLATIFEECNNSIHRLVSSDRTGYISDQGSSSSGGFPKPADATHNPIRQQLDHRPADVYGTLSSHDVLPIYNHDTLWEVLGARPGWRRDVHVGTRGISKGFVDYKFWVTKTKKRQMPSLATYRLPWPDLYSGSTYCLFSFVEMVNACTGSDIFELQ